MDIKNKMDKIFQPGGLKLIIWVIVCFIVIILIFGAGMFVGGAKAKFSYRWAENYHENFGGPRGGFLGDWRKMAPPPADFIQGHGDFGEILKINDSDFVIKGKDGMEKIILFTDNTTIDKGREAIKKDNLKIGDFVVIIGSPNNQGQIEAKFIRIMPSAPRHF